MQRKAMKYNVLIVDDHKLFRKGLRLLIETLDQFEVSGEASNGIEFLEILEQEIPDVVFLDIAMPEMDGIEAARQALAKYPDLKIITLSMFGEQDYYFKMVDAGVRGFLLKNSDVTEVKQALQTIVEGGNYFSHELLMNLVHSLKNAPEELTPNSPLSDREKEIVLLICKGLSTLEIADELCLSKRTVDSHRANILAKTGCRNTASLVVYAIQEKLVEL
ncbi:MAG: response regulator transcription factor [Bacteroidales bacterium]|jgi:DNA-binding NarL/FixJ family response regulator|nr:response regulator transcription factor [Bacteroidales bacterium]